MKKNKILKYGEISEHELYDGDDDYGYGNYTYQNKEKKEKDKEDMMDMEVADEDKAVLDTLSDLLKRMFVQAGFENVFCGSEGLAMIVQVYFDTVEKLSNIRGIMDVLVKIKKDTLKDYDSELTMYEAEEDDEDGQQSGFMEVVFFQRSKPGGYVGTSDFRREAVKNAVTGGTPPARISDAATAHASEVNNKTTGTNTSEHGDIF